MTDTTHPADIRLPPPPTTHELLVRVADSLFEHNRDTIECDLLFKEDIDVFVANMVEEAAGVLGIELPEMCDALGEVHAAVLEILRDNFPEETACYDDADHETTEE